MLIQIWQTFNFLWNKSKDKFFLIQGQNAFFLLSRTNTNMYFFCDMGNQNCSGLTLNYLCTSLGHCLTLEPCLGCSAALQTGFSASVPAKEGISLSWPSLELLGSPWPVSRGKEGLPPLVHKVHTCTPSTLLGLLKIIFIKIIIFNTFIWHF